MARARAGWYVGSFTVGDALVARGVVEHVDLVFFFFPYSCLHHVVLSRVGLGELTGQGPEPRWGLWVASRVCMYVYMHICIYFYTRCAPSTYCCSFLGGKRVKGGSKPRPEGAAGGGRSARPERGCFLAAAGETTQALWG